jgi:hypothetical protein
LVAEGCSDDGGGGGGLGIPRVPKYKIMHVCTYPSGRNIKLILYASRRDFYARAYKKMVNLYVYLHTRSKKSPIYRAYTHIKIFRWCTKEKTFAHHLTLIHTCIYVYEPKKTIPGRQVCPGEERLPITQLTYKFNKST